MEAQNCGTIYLTGIVMYPLQDKGMIKGDIIWRKKNERKLNIEKYERRP